MPWLKPWPAVRDLYAAQLLRMLRLERAAAAAGINVRPRITNVIGVGTPRIEEKK